MNGVAMNTIPNMNMWNTINNLNMQNMLRNNDNDGTTSTMTTADVTMAIIFFVLFAAGIIFLIFWIMDTNDRRWPVVVATILILNAFCIPIALGVI